MTRLIPPTRMFLAQADHIIPAAGDVRATQASLRSIGIGAPWVPAVQ